jgi:hypothetical protein
VAHRTKEPPRQAQLQAQACQAAADLAEMIVTLRDHGQSPVQVVLWLRESLSGHNLSEPQTQLLASYLTGLTQRIYTSQPPWSPHDASQRVWGDCRGDLLQALIG